MARIFRRPRQLHPVAELNITNMVDLGFTLLVIFMIATPLIQKEQTIPVNLPVEAKSTQAAPPDTEFQAVSIDKAGRYYFGQSQVSFTELSSKLAALAAKPKPPVIRIRADFALQWQQVASLISELKKNNLSKITLDTETK